MAPPSPNALGRGCACWVSALNAIQNGTNSCFDPVVDLCVRARLTDLAAGPICARVACYRESSLVRANRIDVGEFIYCRSPYHRTQLNIPKDAGLVLEVKRSNYRILYGADKFCWLPEEVIIRIEGTVDTATFAGRLHWIIKRLKALDCELISEAELHRATFRIDHIDQDVVDDIRDLLKTDFVELNIVPEGMAFMLAEITFRS